MAGLYGESRSRGLAAGHVHRNRLDLPRIERSLCRESHGYSSKLIHSLPGSVTLEHESRRWTDRAGENPSEREN